MDLAKKFLLIYELGIKMNIRKHKIGRGRYTCWSKHNG